MKEQMIVIVNANEGSTYVNNLLQRGWRVVSTTSSNPSWGNKADFLLLLEK